MHFLFVRAAPGPEGEIDVRHPRDEIAACHDVVDAWLV